MASRATEEKPMFAVETDAKGCLSLGSRFANMAFAMREEEGEIILAIRQPSGSASPSVDESLKRVLKRHRGALERLKRQ